MDLRVVGTVLLVTVIFCLTWYFVTIRKQKAAEEKERREHREARNERVYSNGSMSLYEDERQRRIAAETREGIAQDQLKRSRHENERLLKLLAEYEEHCGLYRRTI